MTSDHIAQAARALRDAWDAELAASGPERALLRIERRRAENAHKTALKAHNDALDQANTPDTSDNQPGLFE